MKKCNKCKKDLPLDDFSKQSGRDDSRKPWCKKCMYQQDKLRKNRLKEGTIKAF